MISFMLDSSVCISILRNSHARMNLPEPSLVAIPVMVAAELWTGMRKNLATHPHQSARLEEFLGMFSIPDFTAKEALHYADIRAAFEAAGTPIGPMDLLIAAQARSAGVTLITANAKEFKRVKGLKVREWKKA